MPAHVKQEVLTDMSSFEITCPHCEGTFELTEALAGPLLEAERNKAAAEAARLVASERKSIEAAAAAKVRAEDAAVIAELTRAAEAKDAEIAKARAAEIAARHSQLEAEEAKRNVALEVARQVAVQAEAVAVRAREETAKVFSLKLEAAELRANETEVKLKAAELAELEARKRTAAAAEAERNVELTVARRLDEERGKLRETTAKERDDEHRQKLAERDKVIADLKAQVEEVSRKAAQGSQQLTGEVQEIDLLDVLSAEFPNDRFERTSKGQRGADVRHTVMGPGGAAGVILWEAKRTKLWSDTWLPKLREDQRAAKSDIAVIASEALPAGVAHFECVDGVWVTGFPFIVPLAEAMRQRLVEAARARRAAAGADQKKDLTYDYVTGNEFRSRVAGLLEPIVALRDSLDLEKRTADKLFAARGKQIERLGMNLAGMYGDFQGIVGSSLPIVAGLALPEPEADEIPQLAADGSTGASGEVH
jgi:hypothetical protein